MKVFVGISGASGTVYGAGLLRALLATGNEPAVCISEGALAVIRAEDGIVAGSREQTTAAFYERHGIGLEAAAAIDPSDLTSAFASGSALAAAAAVCPCSMSTLGSIAAGITRNLIHRVADVMLKEGRPLLLVPRETPLSQIHLRNMLAVRRAGAAVIPAMPGFYHRPQSIDDLVDFIAGKILDNLGIDHSLFERWGGTS